MMGGIDEQTMDSVIEGSVHKEEEYVLSVEASSQPYAVIVNGLIYLPKSIFESLIEDLEKAKKNSKSDNWMIREAEGQYDQALDTAINLVKKVLKG